MSHFVLLCNACGQHRLPELPICMHCFYMLPTSRKNALRAGNLNAALDYLLDLRAALQVNSALENYLVPPAGGVA